MIGESSRNFVAIRLNSYESQLLVSAAQRSRSKVVGLSSVQFSLLAKPLAHPGATEPAIVKGKHIVKR